MRLIRKIVRVLFVVALGAISSLPFKRLPPPRTGTERTSDRLVLQDTSAPPSAEIPLQIPAGGKPPGDALAETPANALNGARTADTRKPAAARKDLPVWNSRLESATPPPALPDTLPTDRSTDPTSGF